MPFVTRALSVLMHIVHIPCTIYMHIHICTCNTQYILYTMLTNMYMYYQCFYLRYSLLDGWS